MPTEDILTKSDTLTNHAGHLDNAPDTLTARHSQLDALTIFHKVLLTS